MRSGVLSKQRAAAINVFERAAVKPYPNGAMRLIYRRHRRAT
jgi:hypothetical protein